MSCVSIRGGRAIILYIIYTLYKQKEKAFVPSCTKAAAAHIPHGQMPFPVVRKKEWKKSVKKC